MTTEQFRRAWKAEPFHPFFIKTTSGATYQVNHPEFVSASRSGRAIAIADSEGADAFTFLDLDLIEAIEIGYTKAPSR